jgi:integrase
MRTLSLHAPLRERVLWTLLYESAARAEEALSLNVTDLDTANRCAVVMRKGGAGDVIVWQTGTARLLPRLLAGCRRGPVFLTNRAARPSVALVDVDPAGKARISYRRADELLEAHTTGLPGGPFTLHQLHHSALTHAAEADASTPMLMALSLDNQTQDHPLPASPHTLAPRRPTPKPWAKFVRRVHT